MELSRRPLVPALPLLLVSLASCALGADDASISSQAVSTDGTDPVDHLNVIGADDMEGRGTGTPGFQRAADYVVGECRRAGLAGAFPSADNPYLQPFTVGQLPTPQGAAPDGGDHDFGIDLFEHAIYLSGAASPETRGEMGKRLCSAMSDVGERCPDGVADGSVDPRPLAESAAALAANNVVGLLPGAGPHKSEIIMLSAHLDHLGKTATALYPGADDNGSGSAALLAIMHTLTAQAATAPTHPFDRTIGFIWTAGEERGLLGAAYFVDNTPPALPVGQMKLVVNMDMVGRWDDTRFSIGADTSPVTQAAITEFDAANQAMPTPFARINQDIQQYNRRQDGYAFSRRNVPAMFVFEGLSNPQGGGSLTPVYHKPTDTLASLMAENGGSKIRRLSAVMASAVARIANAPPPSSASR